MTIHSPRGSRNVTSSIVRYNPAQGFRRFGLGRWGNEISPVDVRQWLVSQLDMPDPALAGPGPSTANGILVGRRHEAAMRAGQDLKYGMAELFGEDMTASLQAAVTTDRPFRERLVWFWTNHFTISARAGNYVYGLAGAYIREAIRPHVAGRFADMLKAVIGHPGMLYYLDNWLSDGPHSLYGLTQHRGLNENLARECLELHTIGVDGGYTQADVTEFAAILTGRTINFDGNNPGAIFKPEAHEPGPKRFMGHDFPEGFSGSEAVLDMIASHPATQRHIATKLVRHFVADVPPPACVARVASVLGDSGGDLKQAVLAVIDMPEAWQPLTKFRAPAEYVVAVVRALDLPPEPPHLLYDATRDLGQPFMSPLLPNGWPETADAWLSGEALLKRADWAMTQASRSGAPSARAVADATLGELCSKSTRDAIDACPTPAEALATLFASPEFMRR
jgi:uncharacterized protein (DUF1800 family)